MTCLNPRSDSRSKRRTREIINSSIEEDLGGLVASRQRQPLVTGSMPKLKNHPKLALNRVHLTWPPEPLGWTVASSGPIVDPREIASAIFLEASFQLPGREGGRPHLRLRARTSRGRVISKAFYLDDEDFMRTLARRLRPLRTAATLEELGETEIPPRQMGLEH